MPEVSLAEEKVKIEKIHLVSVQPHHITVGVVSILIFFVSIFGFFCVIEAHTGQEMQIILVLKGSCDVIVGTVHGGWPPCHIKSWSLSKR